MWFDLIMIALLTIGAIFSFNNGSTSLGIFFVILVLLEILVLWKNMRTAKQQLREELLNDSKKKK